MTKTVYEHLTDVMQEFITLNHSTVNAAQQFVHRVGKTWAHVGDEHRLDLLEPLGDEVASDMAEIEDALKTVNELFSILSTVTVKATLDLNKVLNDLAVAKVRQAENN